MMLALSELLCYAAIAVGLDRKYRRDARKSGECTRKWLLKRQDFTHCIQRSNIIKNLYSQFAWCTLYAYYMNKVKYNKK